MTPSFCLQFHFKGKISDCQQLYCNKKLQNRDKTKGICNYLLPFCDAHEERAVTWVTAPVCEKIQFRAALRKPLRVGGAGVGLDLCGVPRAMSIKSFCISTTISVFFIPNSPSKINCYL